MRPQGRIARFVRTASQGFHGLGQCHAQAVERQMEDDKALIWGSAHITR
jgi:hypothetical protein